MPEENENAAGQDEAKGSQVSQAEAKGGQPAPSPPEPQTAHEKLMAGIAQLRAEEEAEATPAGESEEAAEEAPPEGEEAPEKTEVKPEAEPTVAELRAEIQQFNERLKGFQTALNEKDGEVKVATGSAAVLQAELKAIVDMVEEGLPEEDRKAFQAQRQQRTQRISGEAMARQQAGSLLGQTVGLVGRLEAAGLELAVPDGTPPQHILAAKLYAAGQKGIDIGDEAADPNNALFRFGQSVAAFEATAGAKKDSDRVAELEKELAQLKKQEKKDERDGQMRRGEGATNLGGPTGPGFDREQAKPKDLISQGIQEAQAAGKW